ncbi:beta-glucuronosyltransferase GlcAT14A-like [Phragmites australis]|uniref:beta-glucuronosyltransferase GlcAT14A-like n=1 Tax=Phragmites australis TaxID=29695 RepID=UPI002D77D059|nr:beta-glucuronosyltransferase GlcAT14A-like [Phragmites australis]
MRPRQLPPCLAAAALTAAALLLLFCTPSSYSPRLAWPSSRPSHPSPPRAEWGPSRPPSFAYWISGTGGDARRVLRLLRAVYHPRNRYLLHLDAGAAPEERESLATAVRAEGEAAWREFRNVDVLGEGYAVDRAGSSVLAAVLHGAAVLLRAGAHWDWLVTLSAEDYPLVTQDDLLYAFSSVPRDLNFIDHTSDLGWKEHERFEKIIVDPSLYLDKNTEPFPATEIRQMPDAFKIFTGSPWVILSRNFTEHCVLGWDNLPRKLLMYFANTAYSMESYFQTLICNSYYFRNTTVNGDLRYFVWDDTPGLDPLVLDESHFENMVNSSATFARRFEENAPVLKKLDDELLNRSSVQLVPGVWCPNLSKEQGGMDMDSCLKWGDINTVRPGRAGEQLRRCISVISQTRGCS